MKNQYRGGLLKNGSRTACRFKGAGLGKKKRVVFWGEVDTPMRTMTIWKVFLNKIEENTVFNIEEIM